MAKAAQSPDATTEEVRSLEALDLQALRALWRDRIGPLPAMRSPEMLRMLLAWKIQAEAYGDLDAETRRALRCKGPAVPRTEGLKPGTRIVREWQGRRCEVAVVDGGFVYEGRSYRSLSEVARSITGVRWNGPRFFGLRNVEASA